MKLPDDRRRHHLSPPPQFWHGTEVERNILQSPAHETFGPTDSKTTNYVCTRRIFGGIRHRTQAFQSGI
ncbi:hypothetical protein TNCV_303421 [Trichonephila clavipes]|nr:hypothetical protein TNCV_303421 [Trichonephila clavipes]